MARQDLSVVAEMSFFSLGNDSQYGNGTCDAGLISQPSETDQA